MHNENNKILMCCFKLGDDYFSLNTDYIQEIVKPQTVTRVPLMPESINGLMNLRGQIVTSIGMRKIFKITEAPVKNESINIIVRDNESLYALEVDQIEDVLEADSSQREATPENIETRYKGFVDGVFQTEDKVIINLDIESILNSDLTGV